MPTMAFGRACPLGDADTLRDAVERFSWIAQPRPSVAVFPLQRIGYRGLASSSIGKSGEMSSLVKLPLAPRCLRPYDLQGTQGDHLGTPAGHLGGTTSDPYLDCSQAYSGPRRDTSKRNRHHQRQKVDTHEAQQDTRECSPIWYLPAAPALAFDRYDGPGCHPGNHRGPAPTRHYHRSWYCQGSQRAWNLHAKRQPLVCETGAAGHHLRHSEGDRPKPQTAPPLAPWAAPKLNPGTRQSALAGCTPGSSRQWLAANGSSQTIIVSLWVQSGTGPEVVPIGRTGRQRI